MANRLVVAAVVLLLGGREAAPVASLQSPALEDLLKRTGEYQAEYAIKVSGVTLEEQYQLINVSQGRMQSPVRIASDVVLVNANGGIAALRDVYAVDTRPTRDRAPRIASLLAVPEPLMSDWDRASRFPQQGALHFVLDIIVKVNEPTMALRFFPFAAQPSLKYKLEGKKKINGVETVGVGFEEPTGPDKKYVLGTRRNGRAFGRIWVAPETGAVHRTELWVESKGESASVAVNYALHPTLNVLLPAETTETYEEREMAAGPRDYGAGAGSGLSSQHTFQATAKYSNARYSPIDLRKLR